MNKKSDLMKNPNKWPYEAPASVTLGLVQECVICTSPDDATENVNRDNPFEGEGEDW